ncbi:TPA: hypothetical protein P2R06_001876 [Aeromonas veronii]|nr:hypothetical protein [Aeromonas veronii]
MKVSKNTKARKGALFPKCSGDKFYAYFKHSDMLMYITDKIHFQYIIAICGGLCSGKIMGKLKCN